MEKATACLDASLRIECPKCKNGFDLFDDDSDGIYRTPIFTNSWDDLKGEDAFCPKCEYEFQIDSVEY